MYDFADRRVLAILPYTNSVHYSWPDGVQLLD